MCDLELIAELVQTAEGIEKQAEECERDRLAANLLFPQRAKKRKQRQKSAVVYAITN